MDSARREYLINRVLSEYIPERINGERLLFGNPTRLQVLTADDIYQEWYSKGLCSGLLDKDEALSLIYDKGIWSDEQDYILEDLAKDIKKLKMGLLECMFRSSERRQIKTNLTRAKNKYFNLLHRKNAYQEMTAEYIGSLSKQMYLALCEVYRNNGTYYINPDHIWTSNNLSVAKILSIRSDHRWTEEMGRELARSDPWRGIWVAHKDQAFPFVNDCLNDNQNFLLTWSKIYDNVHESMDCPADDVISDDDALDGWFILQKRNRDKDRNQKAAEELTGNEKIKNSDEVFITAETKEDIEKIYDLNDPVARGKARSNLKTVRERGRVKEADMPTTRLKLRMQQQQEYIDKVKGS